MLDLSFLAEAVHSEFVAKSVVSGLVQHDFVATPASWNDIVSVSQPDSFRVRHGFEAKVPVKLDETCYSCCTVPNSDSSSFVAMNWARPMAEALARTVDQVILSKAYNAGPRVIPDFSSRANPCLTEAKKHLDTAKAPDTHRYLIVGEAGKYVLRDNLNLPNQIGFIGSIFDGADKLAVGLNVACHRDALVLTTRPYIDPNTVPGTLAVTVQHNGIGIQTTMLCLENETQLAVYLLAGVGILDKSLMAILPAVEPLDWIGLTN